MKTWIGIPLALFLVVWVILSQVDLESVKETLVERISQETGLKVEMDSLGFSFTHGLGLQLKDVKVNDLKGNHFSVNRLHLLAEWAPLLKGEFKIKSIALERPEAQLEIPETTPKPLPASHEEQPVTPPQTEIIAPETIKSAKVKLKGSQLSIEELKVSDGKITLIRAGTSQSVPLNFDGIFVLNRSAEEQLGITARNVLVQTGSVILEGDGEASNVTADNAAISIKLKSHSFTWKEVQPILQFLGGSTQEALAPLETLDVEQLLIKADFPLNSLGQIDSLKQQLHSQVELKTRNAILQVGDDKFSIEALAGRGTLNKGVLTHNFSGIALGSDFTLNGNLPLFIPDKESSSQIEWKNLGIEKLPLKKGLPWSPSQGTLSGRLLLTGPLPQKGETFPGKLTSKVEFQAENLVMNSAKPSEVSPITVNQINGSGELHQGLLKHEIHATVWGSNFDLIGNLQLDKQVVNSKINWKDFDVSQLPSNKTWQTPEGKVSGSLTLAGPLPTAGKSFPGSLKGALTFSVQNLKLQSNESPDLPMITLNQLEGNGDIENQQVNYSLKGNTFNGTFQSGGRVILSASGSRPPVLNNKIEFSNFDMSQLPFPVKGRPSKGSLSATLKLNGPLPSSESLLTSNLKIDTTFKVTDLHLLVDSQPLEAKQLAGKALLKKGRLTHDLNGSVFGGKIKTNGHLNFQKNKTQTLITADSNLTLNQVGLGWVPLVYKGEEAPSSGTLTGNLKINGPLPSDEKISPLLKLKGILKGEQLVFKKSNRYIDEARLEFKESSANLTEVQVDLKKIKQGDRNFKKVSGLFHVTPEKINLKKGQVWPRDGQIKLEGQFQPESKNYQLRFQGSKLKVEEFLSPHLMGPLQFSGALKGVLPQNTGSLPDVARDLSGDIKIKLVEGTLPELGVLEGLLTLLNPTSVLNAQKAGLSYDHLGGDFKIVKGVVQTSNFEMKGPQVMLTAEGQANLVEDSVLAQVKAMPLQMLDKAIKAIPLLGQILAGGKKGGVIETYFKVDGKLSKPEFTMQPHKSLLEKPGSILNELINIPQNLSGGE